mgnify:CR=1 FL=1
MIEPLSALVSQITAALGPLIKPVINLFQNQRGLNRDNDIAVFRKLDAIANEPRLDDILNALIPNSRFRMEDHYVLADLIDALHRIENTFLNSKLKLKASELAWALEHLLDFVTKTFFKIHSGYLKFYPEPIDRDRYDAERKELNQKIDKAWGAYKDFRLTVKEHLKV